eukprot:4263144-Prymnesium_polylepis.1
MPVLSDIQVQKIRADLPWGLLRFQPTSTEPWPPRGPLWGAVAGARGRGSGGGDFLFVFIRRSSVYRPARDS